MTTFLPGTEVIARGLRWVVAHTQGLGEQTLVRLRGTQGVMQGEEFDLLHPFEDLEPLVADLRPDRAAPKQNWVVYHQAFLLDQALAGAGLVATQPGRLRMEPYQLVPVLRAIRLSRVRLLLADGVGLGKTVQTGLILTELIARRMAHRILIVTPSGPLLDQWHMEMLQRFGLRFDRVDNPKLNEVRRSIELGANPFDHIPFAIASIDFLKQERILELLERATYDAVVIDEAHHCMEVAKGVDDAEDSLRRKLAQTLAARSDSLILATATPHDGNDRSFASLCELLDPSLVDGRGVLRGDRFRSHVVRRLKSHILDPVTRAPKFRERMVEPMPVLPSATTGPDFMALQRGLVELIAPQLKRAFKSRNYQDVLAFIALLKRSVSTARACGRTLLAVSSRFTTLLKDKEEAQRDAQQRLRSLRDLQRKIEKYGAVSEAEEHERQALEIEDIAQQLAEQDRILRKEGQGKTRLKDLAESLGSLIELAAKAENQDPKLAAVASRIVSIRDSEPRANVLVYTEYTDSQSALVEYLNAAGLGTVLSMNGDNAEAERTKITNRFRKGANLILVSTDAASEGLNLHQRCHHLIHLELPFNPNRLEQRNGRIDRYGQTSDPLVAYLYLKGTFEERILLRLIAKYERQRRLLTFVPNTLGLTSTDAAYEKLLAGLMEEETSLFKSPSVEFTLEVESDPSASPATLDLLEEIDRSLHGFRQAAQANVWLGADGLNAEQAQVNEADAARETGRLITQVDLSDFVKNAVRLEGGDVREKDGWFELVLPHSWLPGLNGTPGLEEGGRTVCLTDNLDLSTLPDGRELGFLGRAHPLVQRALDRVRLHSLGGGAGSDARVSAIQAEVSQPTLLFTYAATISSQAGREYERLLAVRVAKGGPATVVSAGEDWLPGVARSTGVRTDGLWEREFRSWGEAATNAAADAARQAFQPLRHQEEQERARRGAADHARLADWLASRAREIIGDRAPQPVQAELFGKSAAPGPVFADWSALSDPQARLAGFATDRTQPVSLRHEADTVLRIYRKRFEESASHTQSLSADLSPVGLLMIIPLQVS
jgi:superfamily II DNA or RNA helicase